MYRDSSIHPSLWYGNFSEHCDVDSRTIESAFAYINSLIDNHLTNIKIGRIVAQRDKYANLEKMYLALATEYAKLDDLNSVYLRIQAEGWAQWNKEHKDWMQNALDLFFCDFRGDMWQEAGNNPKLAIVRHGFYIEGAIQTLWQYGVQSPCEDIGGFINLFEHCVDMRQALQTY